MKMKIMTVAATIIIASFAINTSNAQTKAMNPDQNFNALIKKDNVVNNKVQSRFQKDFPYAENISWVKNKDGYEARFLNKGIATEAGYNKAGHMNYAVEHYAAEELTPVIASQVNDAYKEYDIMNVTEVHSAGQVAYLVNIQSKKFSKIIRINNDGMDVYKNVPLSF